MILNRFISTKYVKLNNLNFPFFFYSFQGIPVTQNVSWGVIISTRSLVLQRVGRNHSGMYACSAANDRGETQSSLVSLRVHCEYSLQNIEFLLFRNVSFSWRSLLACSHADSISLMHFLCRPKKIGILNLFSRKSNIFLNFYTKSLT